VAEPPSFVQGGLICCSADPCQGGYLVDRQIADAMMLHLASDDREHGALAFGVLPAQSVRQRTRAAQSAATFP
jgi:hypothetical protein